MCLPWSAPAAHQCVILREGQSALPGWPVVQRAGSDDKVGEARGEKHLFAPLLRLHAAKPRRRRRRRRRARARFGRFGQLGLPFGTRGDPAIRNVPVMRKVAKSTSPRYYSGSTRVTT